MKPSGSSVASDDQQSRGLDPAAWAAAKPPRARYGGDRQLPRWQIAQREAGIAFACVTATG